MLFLPPVQCLGLFMYFVAAVVIGQRRRILDDCMDSDDVLRAFQQVGIQILNWAPSSSQGGLAPS